MAPRFCAHCGRPVGPNTNFCPACGARLAPSGTLPSGGFAPTGSYPPSPPTFPRPPGVAPVGSGPSDAAALGHVEVAALLAVMAAVLSVAIVILNAGQSFGASASTSSGFSFGEYQSYLYLIVALTGISVVVGVLELWMYRRAFVELRGVDDRFSTPATLVFVAIISVLCAAVIGSALAVVVFEGIACAGVGNLVTGTCANLSLVWTLIGLLVIAAIGAFIGYIGLLVGIWRLGSRYEDGLFKIGAVFLIIPLLNVVGVILIVVAARAAKSKIGRQGRSYSF